MAGRAGRENTEYADFASRVVAAFASRVGEGDIDSLPALVELRAQLDQNIAAAIAELRARPNYYSWAQVAERLGITRQAAMQRWPAPDKTVTRQPGGQPLGVR